MTDHTLVGIGASGELAGGHFVEVEGQWVLQLSDGTQRRFGPRTDYSAEAISRVYASPSAPIVGRSTADAVQGAFDRAAAIILEVTPFCAVGCSTCIASSIATRVGELSLATFRDRMSRLADNPRVHTSAPMMLSGGEPTAHPDFLTLVASDEFRGFPQRFVITHGQRFLDRSFIREFAERSPGTQLYLQYDSFESEHLLQIRGADFADLREQVIARCEEYGVSYTLICVVLRNVNDRVACDVVERNLSRAHCAGVTFQPIKLVGRNDVARPEHQMTTFDLVAMMDARLRQAVGLSLRPHPANPLNWAIGYADGVSRDGPMLYDGGQTKRVAIVWHTDRQNYVLESVARFPIAFAEAERLAPQEVHYSAL